MSSPMPAGNAMPPGPPAPMAPWPPAPKRTSAALIACLVVALVSVPVLGVLASLAIYGARRYLVTAKIAEARANVAALGRAAQAAYERETDDGTGRLVHRLCPSASQSVPVAATRGRKYVSVPSDWEIDAAGNAGFACLRFALRQPQYYQYSYQATGAGNPGDRFTVTAQGDLDADGVVSSFVLEGVVQPDGTLEVARSIVETDPLE
ncbi:MAG: fimbiral protein pilA [Deltaproteobacteria bacterium]|nr:fimbiral protein pilA [Deltaproteobacteria bacterium]